MWVRVMTSGKDESDIDTILTIESQLMLVSKLLECRASSKMKGKGVYFTFNFQRGQKRTKKPYNLWWKVTSKWKWVCESIQTDNNCDCLPNNFVLNSTWLNKKLSEHGLEYDKKSSRIDDEWSNLYVLDDDKSHVQQFINVGNHLLT